MTSRRSPVQPVTRPRATLIEGGLCATGGVLLAVGAGLVYLPAGLIVAGIVLVLAGLLMFDRAWP